MRECDATLNIAGVPLKLTAGGVKQGDGVLPVRERVGL
jgi:hypothetical protein